MSFVNNQMEIKHEIRVESCRRTSLLFAIPAAIRETLYNRSGLRKSSPKKLIKMRNMAQVALAAAVS